MDIRLIDRSEELEKLRTHLVSADRIALDCEAAGFHRYSDRLCLVQLTHDERTYLLDPLSVDLGGVLRPILEDPDREVVMHGADFDLRLLDRDLDINLRGLFDTQIAASILGVDGIGLQSLLERTLDVQLSKKYQRADWAQRPLPDEMLKYAALDTHHLLTLADELARELREEGRMEWAREEFVELEKIRYEEPDDEDPAARLKAARDMTDREVHRLREALLWRDEIARERDRAPFRVANDSVLIQAARQPPASVEALINIRGMNRGLARQEGEGLVRRLQAVESLADHEVQGLPPRDYSGRGRPPPEVQDRMRALKQVRNQRAADLGIDRGTLLPNALLEELALEPPDDAKEVSRVPGIRSWQAEVLGGDLVQALEAPLGSNTE